MKAIVVDRPGELSTREMARPSPGPGEVLIKVISSGICGTDIHIYKGEFNSNYPLVPGHEFAGVVEETGEGVEEYRVGDRVTADPNIFCGNCYFCRTMRGNHCLNWEAIGVTRDGAFAQYVVAPVRNVYSIGELDFHAAAFIEPLSCVVLGVKRLALEPASDVLLFGAGPIGLLLLQVLLNSGASRVVVVDRFRYRLKLAADLGANDTVLAAGNTVEVLKDIAPLGFSAVVDATGVPEVVKSMFSLAMDGGKLLLFGVCPPESVISISPFEIYRRDLTIIGSFALNYTFEPAINLLRSGRVKVEPLLTHTFPLESADEAFSLVGTADALKVQFKPNG